MAELPYPLLIRRHPSSSYGPGMDESSALSALPAPYAAALRLRDRGGRAGDIAAATGVPEDAVAALLEVGQRKLSELLAGEVLASESSELGV